MKLKLALFILLSPLILFAGQPQQGVYQRGTNGVAYGNLDVKSMYGKINTGNTTNQNGSRVAYLSDVGTTNGAGDTVVYVTNIFVTNLFATTINSSNFYATNLFAVSTYISNAFITNLYSSNIFTTNLIAGNTIITSNFFATNIFTTNLVSQNTYASNFYTTNLVAQNTYISNAFITNLYVTNLTVSGSVAGITNTLFTLSIDGGGSAITAGRKGGAISAPRAGTITGWAINALGDSPTCTIDVWKIAQGTALPTVANTIMGTKPALATGNSIKSSTMTSWVTSVANGDIFAFKLDSTVNASNITFQVFFQ